MFNGTRLFPWSTPDLCASIKVDLVEKMGPLPFNLDFFAECQDMRQLLAYLDAPPNVGGEDDSVDGGPHCDGNEGDRSGEKGVTASEPGGDAGSLSGARRGRERFRKLTAEICDVVDSYGLVCYFPLNVQASPLSLWWRPAHHPFFIFFLSLFFFFVLLEGITVDTPRTQRCSLLGDNGGI